MKSICYLIAVILIALALWACGKTEKYSTSEVSQDTSQSESSLTEEQDRIIAPRRDDLLNEKDPSVVRDGTYHVSAIGNNAYEKTEDGQYLSLTLWGYDVYEKEDIESLREGDKIIFKGNIIEVKDLETKSEQGELKECIINGGFEEGGIRICLDYDEDGFRGYEDCDAYSIYQTVARRFRIADSFLYDDHSSVSNIGDEEPAWARGDALTFADFIKDRELYPQNTYATIKNNEIVSLTIEWAP